MAFSNSFKPWFTLMTLLLIVTLISGCWNQNAGEDSFNSKAQAAEFASYKYYPVNVTPNLLPYQVAEDLGNIEISAVLSYPRSREMLAKNYFFVTPFGVKNSLLYMNPIAMTVFPILLPLTPCFTIIISFQSPLEVTEQEHFILP